MRPLALVAFAALFAACPAAAEAAPEPLRYIVTFPKPETHYFSVEARVPTEGKAELVAMMAVWTPGSYLVREYARHIEGLRAEDPKGRALPLRQVTKNRWAIQTGGAAYVRLRYRVYAREMSVRTNWVERDFAMLNGAPSFLTLPGPARQHIVRVAVPRPWSSAICALPERREGGLTVFTARDFDELVDSPIVVGDPAVYEFTVDGKRHRLVNIGEGGVWDGPKSAADVKKIVEAQRDLWGSLPYDQYVFFNVIAESGGGLEHKASTLMLTSRWRTGQRRSYLGWLGLVSHEFFHTWNVKRLRPRPLGPFDYENENYTKSLWIAEGFTSYYTNLVLARAGIMTEAEYLERLSGTIRSLQTTPGRLVQPLEMASFNAWIKHYRRDENSANTSISYYTKGAVVGFLLDAKLRLLSRGERSLDDLMRAAYKRFSGARGYTPEQFRDLASELAGRDLGPWFASVIDTTDELDYSEALALYGLSFKEPEAPKKDDEPSPGWLGLRTADQSGRFVVTGLRRDTPGLLAGFNVDDEILAIGPYRVTAASWKARMQQYPPGSKAEVLISRREKLMRLPVVFGLEPPRRWSLESSSATPPQALRRAAWLHQKPEGAALSRLY